MSRTKGVGEALISRQRKSLLLLWLKKKGRKQLYQNTMKTEDSDESLSGQGGVLATTEVPKQGRVGAEPLTVSPPTL